MSTQTTAIHCQSWHAICGRGGTATPLLLPGFAVAVDATLDATS